MAYKLVELAFTINVQMDVKKF